MTNTRLKYFSFDKIPYLYEDYDEMELPMIGSSVLDAELKIAG